MHPRVPAILAVAVVASLAATAIAQNPGPQGRALVVGVVDLGVVFKGYKRKDELEKQVNAQKERLEKLAQSQRDALQKMRKDLDLLQTNSPTYRMKKYEILTAMKTAEVSAQQAEEELKAQVEGLTLQLLDEIEECVREYGKQNGYDLVLKIDTKGWGDERFQERIMRAQVSSVLYHDPKVDITNSIVAVLNSEAHLQKCQAKTLPSGAPQPAPDTRPK